MSPETDCVSPIGLETGGVQNGGVSYFWLVMTHIFKITFTLQKLTQMLMIQETIR